MANHTGVHGREWLPAGIAFMVAKYSPLRFVTTKLQSVPGHTVSSRSTPQLLFSGAPYSLQLTACNWCCTDDGRGRARPSKLCPEFTRTALATGPVA